MVLGSDGNSVCDVALKALTRLIRFRRKPPEQTARREPSPDEAQQEQELLERIAAGIALNKMPPR